MGRDSYKWCPATGQGVMDTNWNMGSSIQTRGWISLLWGWQSTGTGSPEGLWSLLLWRYSKPIWMLSHETYCRHPAVAGDWTGWCPEVPSSTYSSVWFCVSVWKYTAIYEDACHLNLKKNLNISHEHMWHWCQLTNFPMFKRLTSHQMNGSLPVELKGI